MEWRDSAACLNTVPNIDFFDLMLLDELCEECIVSVREVCHTCPVRRACFTEIMADERGREAADRHGVRAYLSPGQRESIEKRGITSCPACGSVRDPVLLAQGTLHCPRRCGFPDRSIIPPPHQGDQWTKRHTTLSKRIVGWLVDSVDPGQDVPGPSQMSDLMGGVRRSDVLRVYRELVKDGTLVQSGQDYTRGGKVATHNWKPNWFDSLPKEA